MGVDPSVVLFVILVVCEGLFKTEMVGVRFNSSDISDFPLS